MIIPEFLLRSHTCWVFFFFLFPFSVFVFYFCRWWRRWWWRWNYLKFVVFLFLTMWRCSFFLPLTSFPVWLGTVEEINSEQSLSCFLFFPRAINFKIPKPHRKQNHYYDFNTFNKHDLWSSPDGLRATERLTTVQVK